MADDPLGQDDIEQLLRHAQKASAGDASAGTPPGGAAAPASQPAEGALDQSEIEALMAGAGSPGQMPPRPATRTAPPPTADEGAAVTQGDIELLLNQAQEALNSIDAPADLPPGVVPFKLTDFSGTPASNEITTLELVRDVQLNLKIELGRTHMHLEDVLRLSRGAVVPLDKLAGDPVDVYVNDRLIARGEVLVLNDNFCVRVTELVVGDSACA